MRTPSERGSLMLETLIAVGISAMFMSALMGFVLMTNMSTDRAKEYAYALWSAQEGLDALRTIAFEDLTTTAAGRLSFASNRWTLTTGGPQNISNGITQTIKVEDVQRNAACEIVTSGGTVDPDSKKLTSESTWIDAAGRSHTSTVTSLRTRWNDPQGACFVANMAAQITFDLSGAAFSGGKQLRNVLFTNTGTTSAIIDKISFTWDNAAVIDQLFLGTTKIWSASGPGTPSGSQSSGSELDIENFSLAGGDTVELNKGQFNVQMNGVTVTMTVIFSDGSSWTSSPFQPL